MNPDPEIKVEKEEESKEKPHFVLEIQDSIMLSNTIIGEK